MEQNIILESDKLIKKSIAECFEERVHLTPDKAAVEFEGQHFSWQECDRLSDYLVWKFNLLGIQKGMRAGIWCGNHIQWIMVFIALQKIGAITVLINPGYLGAELYKILEYSELDFLFYGEKFKNEELSKILEELDFSKLTGLKRIIQIENKTYMEMMKKGAMDLTSEQKKCIHDLKAAVDYKDTACMLFTSGTTALPKGVMLSHYNLMNAAWMTGMAMHWNIEDKICVMVPLFHCFGMTSCLLASIICGSCLYVIKHYRTLDALDAVQNHGCTVLNGVPSMFLAMVHNSRLKAFCLDGLKSGIIAGSSIMPDDYKMICQTLGMKKLQMSYGQTETSPAISFSEYEETVEQKCDNAGFIIPYIEVCIWSLDGEQNIYHCDAIQKDGSMLGTDQTGETYIRYKGQNGVIRRAVCTKGKFFLKGEIGAKGFNVMKGYFHREEATRETVTDDGWLHTGDLGYVDDSGRLHICGRIKEMIIRGGENISPMEIEQCIKMLPQIKEVKVVGVPEAVLQEEIAACIELNENCGISKKEIAQHCGKYLAGYKVPRYIGFFDKLPVNESNKIKIGELKAKMKIYACTNGKDICG